MLLLIRQSKHQAPWQQSKYRLIAAQFIIHSDLYIDLCCSEHTSMVHCADNNLVDVTL